MNRLAALAACAALVDAPAAVVFTEIQYHPVEPEAFLADGTPALDLDGDPHEFVEIHNPDTVAVDLGGWTLSGGIAHTFPPGTVLAPGAFRAVARDPARLAAVYGLAPAAVSGPYAGTLGNNGDTVRLRDATGAAVDAVSYSSRFPWAMSADALGAQERFTGLAPSAYPHKGRSLQRVSVAWSANDPANWLACPLVPGPTPGAAQAVTRAAPRPVVISLSHARAGDGGLPVRPGDAITVRAVFSAGATPTSAQVEWFSDDVNSTAETRSTAALTPLGNGAFQASLPGQAARTALRYRIRADRGDGLEVVSPRADDPQVAPVGAGGAREAWHGLFVTPTRATANPVYDLLVSSAGLATLSTNISQNPRRATAATALGLPRDVPHVAASAPQWNGTVPALFACDGELFDAHVRHHGSRYHRSVANKSYKLHFPGHHRFRDLDSVFVTGHDWRTHEGQGIFRRAGLPLSETRWVDWYLNADAMVVRLEHGEMDGDRLDRWHAARQALSPGSARESTGELYKAVGNRDASQNNLEGPYTRADEAPLLENAGWTRLERAEWTYSPQSNAWKGPKPFLELLDGMWAARGDSPAAAGPDLPTLTAWFEANWDVESTLTSLALSGWMSFWDDTCHNQFFWRGADGRWTRLPWDFDDVMSASRQSQTLFAGENGAPVVFDGTNWFKDSFLKAFRGRYQQRLWELNNSLLDPASLSALGFPNAASFAGGRKTYVNGQLLGLGAYAKPARPSPAAPASGAAVTGGATLALAAYSHPSGAAHARTLWEIRPAAASWEEAVLFLDSTDRLTSLEIPFDRLVYGQSYNWRATHIDALGHPSVVSTDSVFTWGSANPAAGTLVLNEVLADNRAAAENGGTFPDYVEIRNNGLAAANLTGVGLTDDPAIPARFVFPDGMSLPAGARLVVWCDDDTAAPGLHAGFKLDADGQTVLLTSGATLLDSVTFGPQARDLALGRVADGVGGWQACAPTPGEANTAVPLGPASATRINEWMAAPVSGDDWVELFNPGDLPVSISGLCLSDTPANPALTRLPSLSFLGARGFHRFTADDSTAGASHLAFKLSAAGETLLLTGADGLAPVDIVTFGAQAANTSSGRFPDGAAQVLPFPQTPSPGRANHLPTEVVIRELLARPEVPGTAFVELHNPGAREADLSGWGLGDDEDHPWQTVLPPGTRIPAGGTLMLGPPDFGPAGPVLNPAGGTLVLAEADESGQPTGRRARVAYGASDPGLAFGRVEVDGGAEFWPLTAATPGADNAEPLIPPVLLNEIHYHPPDQAGEDDSRPEFVELHNPSDLDQDLSGWRLRGDSALDFPPGTLLPARGFLLLSTAPSGDTAALAAFRAAHGLPASFPVLGGLSPKLANDTHTLRLERPGEPLAGSPVWVQVDKAAYLDLAPWPVGADGAGGSLQRVRRRQIGNDPSNWGAAAPTPGAPNATLLDLFLADAPTLPGAVVGAAYAHTLSAFGGVAPLDWSIVAGAPPAGIDFPGAGRFSGLPSAAGAGEFTVRLADAAGGSVERVFRLTVAASPLTITTASPVPAGQAEAAYAHSLQAAGGTAPYTWSVLETGLPEGLTLSPAGQLTGMPALPGDFTFIVVVADAGGLAAQAALTLSVQPAPLMVVATPAPPDAVRDEPYHHALAARGGAGARAWSLVGGGLPAGLALTSSGQLAGTPSVTGSFTFTARVSDGGGRQAEADFSLLVTPPPLVWVTSSLPDAVLGDAYAVSLRAAGGTPGYLWALESGTLPAGLTLGADGLLSGVPTGVGDHAPVFRVTDAGGQGISRGFPLRAGRSGPLDHFAWAYVPSSARAGKPFAAQLEARDAAGRVVESFDGPVGIRAASAGIADAPVVFTEVTDEAEDQFEIQNVGPVPVDTAGWYVRVGDGSLSVGQINPVTFALPALLAAGGTLRVSEATGDGRLSFGGAIAWSTANSRGWLALFDASHTLRDFFAFGWSAADLIALRVAVTGGTRDPVGLGHWSGPGAAPGARVNANLSADTWQRAGGTEANTAADWAWVSNGQTFGITNPGLALPWTTDPSVDLFPPSVLLADGIFAGYLIPGRAAPGVVLTARDDAGRAAASPPMDFLAPAPDTDADGMPDAWETDAGLDPGADDAGLDLDGDGLDNLSEFLAGTLAGVRASTLRVAHEVPDGASSFLVTWDGTPGTLYQVETSADLAAWTPLGAPLLARAAGPVARLVNAAGQGRLYLRVVVAP